MAGRQENVSLAWTGIFNVARATKVLSGDKILLPQSALEQLLAASTVLSTPDHRNQQNPDSYNSYSRAAGLVTQPEWQDSRQQLPHPLVFRLVNTQNGNIVYAGIREFSAKEGEVELSPFLLEALGITVTESEPESGDEPDKSRAANAPGDVVDGLNRAKAEIARITIHAKQLPKGTYVRLRPLEAGYNPDDWKSLLERHLRDNFTTLTNGEILAVPGVKAERFRFLIDNFEPGGEGICVVDTDLEVDIEALNEEQARETLKQIMEKARRAPDTAEESSVGGKLSIWKSSEGMVVNGDYVDYQLPSWDKSQAVNIELSVEDGEEVKLFVSPFSTRQRAKPREDEHVFSDGSNDSTKVITVQPSNIELEYAEAIYISVYALESNSPKPHSFSLQVRSPSKDESLNNPVSLTSSPPITDIAMNISDAKECKNCLQCVPSRTMLIHEGFCLRNNAFCLQCKQVFQKSSVDWENHWHCAHDSSHGNSSESKKKHDDTMHTQKDCPGCSYVASNLRDLANHRTSTCPGKLILCQFCHLEVPQEGDPFDPTPESLISGLSQHEVEDGARTTECHLCSKIIRLRDMSTHLKHHQLEREARVKPAICRNLNCGRTLSGVGRKGEINVVKLSGQGTGNDLGLCSICFGPLYVNAYDPTGSMMRRRIERNYLSQMMKGCGRAFCRNEYCKTAKSRGANSKTTTAQEALPLITPLVESVADNQAPLYFCTDESSQERRKLAHMLSAEGAWELEWCVAALEAENSKLDDARIWLMNWAPTRDSTA